MSGGMCPIIMQATARRELIAAASRAWCGRMFTEEKLCVARARCITKPSV